MRYRIMQTAPRRFEIQMKRSVLPGWKLVNYEHDEFLAKQYLDRLEETFQLQDKPVLITERVIGEITA